jgi:hypothetical protein
MAQVLAACHCKHCGAEYASIPRSGTCPDCRAMGQWRIDSPRPATFSRPLTPPRVASSAAQARWDMMRVAGAMELPPWADLQDRTRIAFGVVLEQEFRNGLAAGGVSEEIMGELLQVYDVNTVEELLLRVGPERLDALFDALCCVRRLR